MEKIDFKAVENNKKDYSELVYWIWMYFGGIVIGSLIIVWQWSLIK